MTQTRLSRSPLFFTGLVVIIVVVIAAQFGAFYQLQALFSKTSTQQALEVSTLINYGNGTSIWHNRTDVSSGWNFYQLTTTIAQVEAQSFSNQHFITALDGVRGAGQFYWTLWTLCRKDMAWSPSPVGADLISLKDGDVLAWYYQAPQSANPATWSPPVSSAEKVDSCTP